MPVSLASNSAGSPRGAIVPIGSFSITNSTTFFNIPQIYQDLMVVYSTRDTANGILSTLFYYLNADGAGNYSFTTLEGNGTTATSSRQNNVGAFVNLTNPAGAAPRGIFGSNVVHILNYRNSSYFKTVLSKTASDITENGTTRFSAGLWRSTAPITSISAHSSTGSFAPGSTVSIYGIRSIGQ
jgi:hypothetical protein